MNWNPTPEMIDELRRLAASGLTDPKLGRHFGVPVTTILHHRSNNKIPTGYVRPDWERPPEGFLELAPTVTKADCARHFGVSTTTVRRWYKKTGMIAAERVYPGNAKPQPSSSAGKGFWRPAGVVHQAALPSREATLAASAQLHLQRLYPVYRASVTDASAPADAWMVNGRRVTEAELISLAMRRGLKVAA